jgi:hypothetical protein
LGFEWGFLPEFMFRQEVKLLLSEKSFHPGLGKGEPEKWI